MSVIDRLISGLHFNNASDDDGYENDDYDAYEDEEPPVEDTSRRRGFFGRNKGNEEEDPPEEPAYNDDVRQAPQRPAMTRQPIPRSNSMPVPSRRSQSAGSNMQVRIIKPSTFDQASEITDTLLSHRTVLLNLEGLDVNTAQRIVDFASGSCYALHGNFMKISHFIIVITPEDVDIAGDIDSNGSLMGMLNGGSGAGTGSSAGTMPNSAANMYGAAYNSTAGYNSAAGTGTYGAGSYGYTGYGQNSNAQGGYQASYN